MATLHDVASWPDWAPGIRRVRLLVGGDAVLEIEAPRPLEVRVAVATSERGLAVRLVEGDLRSLDAEAFVSDDALGVRVHLAWPTLVPGTLEAELEQHYAARWLAAWQIRAGARPRTGPDAC